MRFAIAELLERTQRGGSESLITLLYRFSWQGNCGRSDRTGGVDGVAVVAVAEAVAEWRRRGC